MVTVPYWMPSFAVDQLIREKNDWIMKHFIKFSSSEKEIQKNYVHGEKHLFFGKEYPLFLKETDTLVRTKAELFDDRIEMEIYSGYSQEERTKKVKDALLNYYMEKGIEIITEKVNYYSGILGLSYKGINLKKVSSIWGSCSWQNNLNFNRKLVMAPHEIVDYVVIHEVCHMIHRNHSSHFWGEVCKLDPKFRDHRRWLRVNHQLLSI